MKKLNKLAVLFATVAVAGSAVASDNWNNVDGQQWKNGTNELCWRNNFWTPASAAAGCDGAIVATKAAPAPAPAPVAAPAVSSRVTFSADAFFDFDKATLKPTGRAKLDKLSSDLRRVSSVSSILVVGYTDSKGTDAYNLRLGQRRADSVASYLTAKGVPGSLITTRSMGKADPVAPNTLPNGKDNPAGRALNRRVVITVTAQEHVISQ